mmetsp:Transcript_38700/g.122987  ORF Transcript_38700/g.122987 Transcript_38700/m.122987 type:complete len:426 (-) Transcript_38700:55-1332(-)
MRQPSAPDPRGAWQATGSCHSPRGQCLDDSPHLRIPLAMGIRRRTWLPLLVLAGVIIGTVSQAPEWWPDLNSRLVESCGEIDVSMCPDGYTTPWDAIIRLPFENPTCTDDAQVVCSVPGCAIAWQSFILCADPIIADSAAARGECHTPSDLQDFIHDSCKACGVTIDGLSISNIPDPCPRSPISRRRAQEENSSGCCPSDAEVVALCELHNGELRKANAQFADLYLSSPSACTDMSSFLSYCCAVDDVNCWATYGGYWGRGPCNPASPTAARNIPLTMVVGGVTKTTFNDTACRLYFSWVNFFPMKDISVVSTAEVDASTFPWVEASNGTLQQQQVPTEALEVKLNVAVYSDSTAERALRGQLHLYTQSPTLLSRFGSRLALQRTGSCNAAPLRRRFNDLAIRNRLQHRISDEFRDARLRYLVPP